MKLPALEFLRGRVTRAAHAGEDNKKAGLLVFIPGRVQSGARR
jgi:hypothetical protein